MKRQSHSSRRRPMSETSCGIKGTRRCWRILAGCMLVTLVAACGSTIPAPIPSPTTVSTPAQVGGPRTGPTNGTVTMTPIAEYDLDLSSGSYSVERNDGMVRALPDGLLFEPNAIALVMPAGSNQDFNSCTNADWARGEWYSNMANYILAWDLLTTGAEVCIKSWHNQPENRFVTLLKVQRPWNGKAATFAVTTWGCMAGGCLPGDSGAVTSAAVSMSGYAGGEGSYSGADPASFGAFSTPANNILCGRASDQLLCVISQHDFAVGACDIGQPGFTIALRATGPTTVSNCANDASIAFREQAQVVKYGVTVEMGVARCEVSEQGVRCTNSDKHGFTLARSGHREF
jgi:hypothetical protein